MGLSIVAVTINCRDPRSLAEWWAETLDEGEITHDLGEYVFVRAGRVELGFQGVAAAARERIRLHLDLEANDAEAEVRRLVDRGAVVVEQHEVAPLGHGVDGAARSRGQRLLRLSQRHDHSGVRAANVVGPHVAGKCRDPISSY
jgi:hypothetical protein